MFGSLKRVDGAKLVFQPKAAPGLWPTAIEKELEKKKKKKKISSKVSGQIVDQTLELPVESFLAR